MEPKEQTEIWVLSRVITVAAVGSSIMRLVVANIPCGKHNYLNVERSGSGVELWTLDYENPGSNPVLWC